MRWTIQAANQATKDWSLSSVPHRCASTCDFHRHVPILRRPLAHGSVLDRAGLVALEPGERVSVMVEQGALGPQAMDIELA